MATFVIEGNNKLSGDIIPQGAKNEALQVICATLLTPEKVTILQKADHILFQELYSKKLYNSI